MTPARTNATISSRAGVPSVITSATEIAWPASPTLIRAVADSPNQRLADVSSVHSYCAVSTERPLGSCSRPKPRPITASATSATGMAPGIGHGQRSRSRWSTPVNSSIVVEQSTLSTPCHSVRVWL